MQPAEKPAVLFGFAVSKKLIPLAVRRNSIRRLMREAVRKHFAELKMVAEEKKLSVEIVISFRAEEKETAATISQQEIESGWIQLQRQISTLL
jgi:RNase P protein component